MQKDHFNQEYKFYLPSYSNPEIQNPNQNINIKSIPNDNHLYTKSQNLSNLNQTSYYNTKSMINVKEPLSFSNFYNQKQNPENLKTELRSSINLANLKNSKIYHLPSNDINFSNGNISFVKNVNNHQSLLAKRENGDPSISKIEHQIQGNNKIQNPVNIFFVMGEGKNSEKITEKEFKNINDKMRHQSIYKFYN